jgi:hypothetical protein
VRLLVLGGNLLYNLGRDRLPPQVFWWAIVVFLGAVLVAFAVIRRRIRKVSP